MSLHGRFHKFFIHIILMKKIITLVLVVAAAFAVTVPASAQFRFGIKAGVNVSALHFDSKLFDDDNRAGFTGGVMAEFTVPLIGVGCDLSALYVRRNAQFMVNNQVDKNNRDYIEIPLNLKYKLSIPVINNIFRPFITTGPSVAFLTSRKYIEQAYKNHSCDFAWNFGLGFELIKKIQIAASYSLGINKAVETLSNTATTTVEGKNRYWTVTAAYLF